MMTYETLSQFPSNSHRDETTTTTYASMVNKNKPLQYHHQQPCPSQQPQPKPSSKSHPTNTTSSSSSHYYEDGPLCRAMSGWIATESEPLTLTNAQHYLRLIRDIMVLINPHSLKDNLLLSAVFYADRFVQRRGVKLEEPRKAFLVLLISALVTIKMWEDFEVKTETLERYTGISKKQISVLERQFLGVLEYSLFYSYEEMVSFQIEWCFPQPPTA